MDFNFINLLNLFISLSRQQKPLYKKQSFKCDKLSTENYKILKGLQSPTRRDELLKHVLIPRVSGTDGAEKVKEYIIDKFKYLGWKIEVDKFTDDTPLGKIEFSNIIVTKNPYAKRKIILAAHYDSKYFHGKVFLGATDSAVSCVLLIDLAIALNDYLDKGNSCRHDISLELIFFDGEEAFVEWNDTDSIYGARHLAKKWETEYAVNYFNKKQSFINRNNEIEVLVLLDLIGAKNTFMVNMDRKTEHIYNLFIKIEQEIFSKKLKPVGYIQKIFLPNYINVQIEDDHIPFKIRNVPILHLIPPQFPKFWHTVGDDASAISPLVIEYWSLVLYTFTSKYLCLFD